ncbi:MAG TPA: hypothetical protein VF995_04395, partial [Actinomycetota bacterium]
PYSQVEGHGLFEVLEALAAGRVAISATPTGPVIMRYGGQLMIVDASGANLITPEASIRPVRSSLLTLPAGSGLYRLTDPAGAIIALSP